MGTVMLGEQNQGLAPETRPVNNAVPTGLIGLTSAAIPSRLAGRQRSIHSSGGRFMWPEGQIESGKTKTVLPTNHL
ncbi:hypothetical protein A9W96_26525 [Mycobacterium sp. 1245852.3]|nr:hypothetical protein A9W96_26525 [Mycobacterium sp. 1245852.3]